MRILIQERLFLTRRSLMAAEKPKSSVFFVDNRVSIWYNIICDRTGQSRDMAPKGIIMRKVRASQGRITDNVRRGRPPGKCNREIPPHSAVRMERRGKSSPASAATQIRCKPYPKQHRMWDPRPISAAVCPADLTGGTGLCPGARRQRRAEIDDCRLQNPAYRSDRRKAPAARRTLFRPCRFPAAMVGQRCGKRRAGR